MKGRRGTGQTGGTEASAGGREDAAPAVSIVVPLYDEEESLPHLIARVREAMDADGARWELLLVDDGSRDATPRLARRAAHADPRIRAVLLARNYGQSTALQAGFDHATGAVVVTMDGDLQNDPRDIPLLLATLERGYDLVAGYRSHRKDPVLLRKLPSWIANRVMSAVTGVRIRDAGCTLKAFRRELLDRLRLYSDHHRFIPVLAASFGARIAQVPVRHHPRRHGTSKYGLLRTPRVLIDLLSVKVLARLRRRPHVVFAAAAPVAFGATLAFLAAWAVALVGFRPVKAEALVFPGAAALCAAAGIYLVMLGLLAELALRMEGHRSRSHALVWEIR